MSCYQLGKSCGSEKYFENLTFFYNNKVLFEFGQRWNLWRVSTGDLYTWHVEKSEISPYLSYTKFQISPHDRCGEIRKFSTYVMCVLWTMFPQCIIYAVLFQDRFFCNLRCFVAVCAHLCGENLNQKLCLWRRNQKSQAWTHVWALGKLDKSKNM